MKLLRHPPFTLLCTCVWLWTGNASAQTPQQADLVIYGGTSAGVAAAVQAARMGKSVILIEPGKHIGGLTSGGLGATDIGNKAAIGGISREFYRRVKDFYEKPEAWKFQKREEYRSDRWKTGEDAMWTFEPQVAENILKAMLAEAKIPVIYQERLDLKSGVKKDGNRILSITMESGKTYEGKQFIDATYEGDLMALAGVAYHVGRESNSTYNETLNGVQLGSTKHQFKVPVDPYIKPGDPASGLLPGVHGGDPGKHGEGDHRVQAYNFRMCMTDAPDNRIPFPKPEGYDAQRYELLARYINAGVFDALGLSTPMPNRKTDTNNNGAFSSDNIGMNYDYPEGNYATRERIFKDHVTYQQGMMWFLANDPRVPEKIRAQVSKWGLPKDEFTETGGWPHQLYVREARRMIGDIVMTQHHCQGRIIANHPVGLAAYTMDSHNTQRYVKDGSAINEGDVQVGGFPPYPIDYGAITPKKDHSSNLLVPICLSASHIAYGSIRMEPVFMVLGQSAATAASHAIDEGVAIQDIDKSKLNQRLLADKQILEWKGGSQRSILAAKLPGVVLDDHQAERVGDWQTSYAVGHYVGAGYLHDNNTAKGEKLVRFYLPITIPGEYEVRLSYTSNPNRATAVPVTIQSADGSRTLYVNQRTTPAIDKLFHSLGTFRFDDPTKAIVEVSNKDTDGHVIADAVQIRPS